MKDYFTDAVLSSNPSLEKLPNDLPNLRKISIWFYKSSQKSNISKSRREWHLQSFKDLTEKLPALERISFNKSYISNLI